MRFKSSTRRNQTSISSQYKETEQESDKDKNQNQNQDKNQQQNWDQIKNLDAIENRHWLSRTAQNLKRKLAQSYVKKKSFV